MFHFMYLLIQQILVMKDADEDSSGLISGLFNSVKSIGMIAGSLTAGFFIILKVSCHLLLLL